MPRMDIDSFAKRYGKRGASIAILGAIEQAQKGLFTTDDLRNIQDILLDLETAIQHAKADNSPISRFMRGINDNVSRMR